MRLLLALVPIVLIGCSSEEKYSRMEIDDYGTSNYFIPDSSIGKYDSFVSKSVAGCKDDCSKLLWGIKQTAGELYGSRRYMVIEYYGSTFNSKRIVKELAVEEMNERQLEYFKKYFQ